MLKNICFFIFSRTTSPTCIAINGLLLADGYESPNVWPTTAGKKKVMNIGSQMCETKLRRKRKRIATFVSRVLSFVDKDGNRLNLR